MSDADRIHVRLFEEEVLPAQVLNPFASPPKLLCVYRAFHDVCPLCSTRHVQHLVLAEAWGTASCPRCGFVWYERDAEVEA